MASRFAVAFLILATAALVWADPAQPKADEPKKPEKPAIGDLPDDPKAEKKLLKLVGDGFKIKKTAHFIVAYDTNDATIKAFTSRIEKTYNSVVGFTHRAGVTVKQPEQKLQILFFDEFAGYLAYSRTEGFPASEETPGFYNQLSNRSAFFNYGNATSLKTMREQIAMEKEQLRGAAASGQKPDFSKVRYYESRIARQQERINCLIVQHEVAHQVLFNIGLHVKGPGNPRWFSEGLAMMFETAPTKAGAGIGAVNQERLGNWLELKKEKKLPDPKKLVCDPKMIMPGGGHDVGASYAQAWALVHYLQRVKSKEMVTYIDLIRQRKEKRIYKPEEELRDFEKAFGPLDAKFLEKWDKYISKIPFKPIEAGL